MFVLQEGYSISENGRDFLGAVHTYPFFIWKPKLFLRFQNEEKNSQSRPLMWIIFAFPLGRKRKSDRKRYHLWWEHAPLVESKSATCSIAIRLDPTPARNRFQKPPFTSNHTSKAKRPRFQKICTLESICEAISGKRFRTHRIRADGRQTRREKISSSDKYKDISWSCLMRLLLIFCTSVYKIKTVFNIVCNSSIRLNRIEIQIRPCLLSSRESTVTVPFIDNIIRNLTFL